MSITPPPLLFTTGNFSRRRSPFDFGVRPICLSEKALRDNNTGWHRVGDGCSYYRQKRVSDDEDLYSLTFTFEFDYSKDTGVVS
jgi:hypothetical protein